MGKWAKEYLIDTGIKVVGSKKKMWAEEYLIDTGKWLVLGW